MPGEYKDNAELSSEISASGAGAVLLTVQLIVHNVRKYAIISIGSFINKSRDDITELSTS